jgi:tetratricopeptide (TPR) repeat protein
LSILIAAAEELISAEAALGAEHAGVAILLLKLAELQAAQRKLAEAEPLYLRAIAILEKSFGSKDAEVATALYKLALLYMSTNKPMDAESLLWRVIDIRQQVFGFQHDQVADCLEALAQIQEKEGNYEQAEKHYLSCLSIRETGADTSHDAGGNRDRHVALMEKYANLLETIGRIEESRHMKDRAIKARMES